jgi:hypothetical protein
MDDGLVPRSLFESTKSAKKPLFPSGSKKLGNGKLVKFSNRISPDHKEKLERVKYWRRKEIQWVLGQALDQYFAHQKPEHLAPIPENEA